MPVWLAILQTVIFAGQLVFLFLSAVYARRYVDRTKELIAAAAEQARISTDQIEGQSRPVLVIRATTKVELVNVGNGPALNVEWWPWPEHEGPPLPARNAPSGRIPFIEPGAARDVLDLDWIMRRNSKLVIWYKSCSGREYRTDGYLRQDTMIGVWTNVEIVEEQRPASMLTYALNKAR